MRSLLRCTSWNEPWKRGWTPGKIRRKMDASQVRTDGGWNSCVLKAWNDGNTSVTTSPMAKIAIG